MSRSNEESGVAHLVSEHTCACVYISCVHLKRLDTGAQLVEEDEPNEANQRKTAWPGWISSLQFGKLLILERSQYLEGPEWIRRNMKEEEGPM